MVVTTEKWYARKSAPSPFKIVDMWASSLANLCLPRSSYRAVHDRCSRAVSRRAPACLCRYRVLYHHEEQHGKPGLETSTGAVEWVEALQHFVPGLGRCSHADVQPVSSLWPVQNQTPRSFLTNKQKSQKTKTKMVPQGQLATCSAPVPYTWKATMHRVTVRVPISARSGWYAWC